MTAKQKIIFASLIFAIGMLGVLSLLTMEITLSDDVNKILHSKFTPEQIKFLILINPTIFLIIAVLIGTLLFDKVNLDAPIIRSIVSKKRHFNLKKILMFGIVGGIISGVLISIIGTIFNPYLPQEMINLGEKIHINLANRLLYGGITEETLMRFGFMTLVVWLISIIFKSKSTKIYWIGIVISSIIFALGHFPIVFKTVNNPSFILLFYVLIGNSIGGLIFGWLYWKKGLEAAMVAHIFAHLTMVLFGYL